MGRYLRTTPKATLAFGLERPPPASISAFDPKQHRQFLLNWTSVQLATFLSIDENRKCEAPNVAVLGLVAAASTALTALPCKTA
jgi:hypothetical protein